MNRVFPRGCRALSVALVFVLLAAPAMPVSFAAERELGAGFALAARARLPMITEPAVVAYVDGIGQRIVRSLEDSFFRYQFAVVAQSDVNAFAVPGGYVYVYAGLLTRARNEDEIAAVLAHEVAHVHAHHLARQQEATQLMSYAALLGVLLSVVQPAIGAVATGANAAVQLKYRREFEQEADYMAVRYIRTAGYDPRAMLDFFKQLADEQRTRPASVAPYLLSHPLTDERLNHLEAVLRTQQWAGRQRGAQSLRLRYVQAITRAQVEPPGDVVAAYHRAVAESPSDPVGRYLLGAVCLQAGQLDAARGALEEAQAAGVEGADRELGRLALRLRELEKGLRLLTRAVELDPGDAGAYLDLAQVREASGELGAAMEAYAKAVELAPELDAAHYGLGILVGRAGKDVDGFYHLASAQRLRGDYQQALSQYIRAEALMPVGDTRRDEVQTWIRVLSDFIGVRVPKEE